jgi:hypothetical protein
MSSDTSAVRLLEEERQKRVEDQKKSAEFERMFNEERQKRVEVQKKYDQMGLQQRMVSREALSSKVHVSVSTCAVFFAILHLSSFRIP